MFRKSGLVREESLASEDESDSVFGKVKDKILVHFKDLLSSPKACGEELTVIKAAKVKSTKYGDVYNMTSKPRGICLIIDNQSFSVPDLPFRKGSRADADRLSNVFSQLGFDIFRYTNQNVAQMETLLKQLSINPELAYHDALAVIILSHGIADEVYGSDGGLIPVANILSLFNNINCRLMVNKPKMFFLSSCRGSKFWVLIDLIFEILIIDILKLTKIYSIKNCIKPLITGQVDSGIEYCDLNFLGSDGYQHLGPPQSLSRSSIQRTSLHVPTWGDMFVYYSSVTGIFFSFRSLLKTKTYSNL